MRSKQVIATPGQNEPESKNNEDLKLYHPKSLMSFPEHTIPDQSGSLDNDNEYSTLPKSTELEPYHLIQICLILRTPLFCGGGESHPLTNDTENRSSIQVESYQSLKKWYCYIAIYTNMAMCEMDI